MSFAFRRSPKDWLMSDAILDQAGEAIERDVKIVYDFDIPYVAGYSKRGDTFYIDHRLPKGFEGPHGFFDVTVPLLMHEGTEDGLLKLIKTLPYQLAHQVALHAEKALVQAHGIKWTTYNDWCMAQIKAIGSRPSYDHCPPDLDLKPYLDEEDWATLRKMKAEGRPLWDGRKDHAGVI